jgi:hypothetical protein
MMYRGVVVVSTFSSSFRWAWKDRPVFGMGGSGWSLVLVDRLSGKAKEDGFERKVVKASWTVAATASTGALTKK